MPIEDAVLNEGLQATSEYRARDSQIALEVIEPPHAEKRLAQDQRSADLLQEGPMRCTEVVRPAARVVVESLM